MYFPNNMKKKWLKTALALTTAVSILTTAPGVVAADWQVNSSGWWWSENGGYISNSFRNINGTWYFFNTAGYMVTGWTNIYGTWYYFNSSGSMVTGWQFINGSWYFFNGSGAMVTGWLNLNGTWYFLNSSGAMVTGWQFINGAWYFFNGSGSMVTGWQFINGFWYFFNGSGAMVTNWQFINNRWYFFDNSGAMLQGWQIIGNNWYFFDGSGSMTVGWAAIGNNWYFFDNSGAMLQGHRYNINNSWYTFDQSGAWLPQPSNARNLFIQKLNEVYDEYARIPDSYPDYNFYHIYDFDGNGIDDLIIYAGTYELDSRFTVYSICGDHLETIAVLYGAHSYLYECPQGGVYRMEAHQSIETIYHEYLHNGHFYSIEVYYQDGQTHPELEYFYPDFPMEFRFIVDYSLL